MSIDALKIGLRHENSIMVEERLTAPSVAQAFTGFADMPPVFATAFMIGFVEWTCIEALRRRKWNRRRSRGANFGFKLSAATRRS